MTDELPDDAIESAAQLMIAANGRPSREQRLQMDAAVLRAYVRWMGLDGHLDRFAGLLVSAAGERAARTVEARTDGEYTFDP